MHNWPRADYLQVPLGRVKNSISSAQALGTGAHRGGLFLGNKGEMASHFIVTAGRGHRFVYILQRGHAWAPQASGRGQESKREQAFQSKSRLSPSHQARQKTQGLLRATWHQRPAQTRLPVTAHFSNCFSFSHNNPPPSP